MSWLREQLWALSMRYIVWAFTHLLPARTAAHNPEASDRQYGFRICPERDRWTLHTLAAAPPDHPYPDLTFWVRAVDRGRAVLGRECREFRATEVESGVSSIDGDTPVQALANYWNGKF